MQMQLAPRRGVRAPNGALRAASRPRAPILATIRRSDRVQWSSTPATWPGRWHRQRLPGPPVQIDPEAFEELENGCGGDASVVSGIPDRDSGMAPIGSDGQTV
jgi:hypothetical protein